MKGSVSVCIPAFRHQFLATAIESILSQTQPVEEIIVVDDCSPEDLSSLVEKYARYGVRYIRNEHNLGIPDNYNFALSRASSDYVMIFEDHDVMLPSFIELHAGLLDEDPQISFVFSASSCIDETGNIIKNYKKDLFPAVFNGQELARLLVTEMASPVYLDTLIRKSKLLKEEVWFDTQYWWYADIDLWIRLSAKGKVAYVNESVLLIREREQGHYLEEKIWQSAIICERIRKNNWALAFPPQSLASWRAKLVHNYLRDKAGLFLIANNLANKGSKKYEPMPKEALNYFSPVGRLLAFTLLFFPPTIMQSLKRLN
jgi:glycosyltransferase involved in cell wall biosynthesis